MGGGYGRPLFGDFVGIFLSAGGSQGPSDAPRPGPFVWEGGLLRAPSQALFTRTLFCSLPFFFFFFLALGATPALDSLMELMLREWNDEFQEPFRSRIIRAAPRNPRKTL